MRHYLVTAPAVEPITTTEAIAHMRLGADEAEAELALIGALITSARNEAESITGRALVNQTWALKLDAWPTRIKLPRQAVQSVASITYLDENGALQTLAADQYQLTGWESSEIIPAYNVTWPAVLDHEDVITVTWTAGYGATAAPVPQPIKSWMQLKVATLYTQREGNVTGTLTAAPFVDCLLEPYQVLRA